MFSSAPHLSTFLLLLFLLTLTSAHIYPKVLPRSTLTTAPLPPSQDPFYTPPTNYTSTPPGTILRTRILPGINATISLQTAYQLLYRTSTATGNATATVTTVLIPPNANFSTLLSHQLYYDEADWDCSPSYALRLNATSNATVAAKGELQSLTQQALAKGIVVSLADYEGPAAAFTAGPASAYGVLDAIRAVLSSGNVTGVLPTAQTILFGYSGGSIATEWATELAASYAPEVKIIGAAMGGLAVNQTTTFLANTNSSRAGFVVASTLGLAAAYPAFATALNNSLIPSKAAAFRLAGELCENDARGATSGGGYLGVFANQDIFSYFTSGRAFLASKPWLHVLRLAGVMGTHGVPKAFPLYIYKGTKDEVVPTIQETDDLVGHFCAKGAKVMYVRYVNGTHGSTLTQGSGAALGFLFDIIAGGKGVSKCMTSNVSSGLS